LPPATAAKDWRRVAKGIAGTGPLQTPGQEFFQSLRKSVYTYLSAPCVDNEWTGLMGSGESIRF